MHVELACVENCSKIGVFCCDFNPINNNHLETANEILKKMQLDKIIFVLLKPNKTISYDIDFSHKLVMLNLAILNYPNFIVSSFSKNNYEANNLNDIIDFFRHIFNNKVYYILFSDDLINLNIDEEFIIIKKSILDKNGLITNKNIVYFNLLANFNNKDESDKDFLPLVVNSYIIKNHIYNKSYYFNFLTLKVKEALSNKRFDHTKRVVDESIKLAIHYNCCIDKVAIGALLHDFCKEMKKDEIIQYCIHKNIILDDIVKNNLHLAHGFIAAKMAQDVFGIYDFEIINSIKYHTLGRKNMSMIEKIVFLADYIEPNRNEFDDLSEIRILAYENIDLAIIGCLKNTIFYCLQKNINVHYDSIEALNFLINFYKNLEV